MTPLPGHHVGDHLGNPPGQGPQGVAVEVDQARGQVEAVPPPAQRCGPVELRGRLVEVVRHAVMITRARAVRARLPTPTLVARLGRARAPRRSSKTQG